MATMANGRVSPDHLRSDDSHEITCLICYFLKKQQNLKLSSAVYYMSSVSNYYLYKQQEHAWSQNW